MCLVDQIKSAIGGFGMLILSRRVGATVTITVPPSDVDRTIYVSLVGLRVATARIGFAAERDIIIDRFEITELKRKQSEEAAA